jgi:hypothetical protein
MAKAADFGKKSTKSIDLRYKNSKFSRFGEMEQAKSPDLAGGINRVVEGVNEGRPLRGTLGWRQVAALVQVGHVEHPVCNNKYADDALAALPSGIVSACHRGDWSYGS